MEELDKIIKNNNDDAVICQEAKAKVNTIAKKAKKYKLKKLKKTITISASSIVIVATIVAGSSKLIANAVDKSYTRDLETVNYYDEQRILAGKLPDAKSPEFYRDYEYYINLKDLLPKYVECAKELHKLGLDKYDITYFNDEVSFIGTSSVYEKIGEYKELFNKVHISNDVIDDDVIKLNYLAYELKELEKMYNSMIFDGYATLEEYGLASTKLYLADLYGGDPSKYEIQFTDYHHNGGIKITGPGIHYGDKIDSDIYEYLNAVRDVYKAENAIENPNPEEYNSDRNNLIINTIEKYNTEGADVIHDIERQNKKK